MNLTKNFLLILLSSLFALFVLEYGSYLILYILKNNNLNISGQVALGRAIEEETPSLSTVIPHPYSLYWNNPNFTDAVYGKQFNSLGHRSIEFKDLPTNAYKILVLGGSTTNMWPFVKDRNKIWTSLLENKLSKKYGTDIAVINAGLPYGTSSD